MYRLLSIFSGVLLALVLPAHAAVISVNETSDLVLAGDARCSLREALDNANLAAGGDGTAGDCVAGDPGADTIDLPPGTYTISLGASGDDANAGGDFDILDDLNLVGAGADTIIDADGLDRAIDVAPGGQVVSVGLSGCTLLGGLLAAPSQGGGLRIAASATVDFSDGLVSTCVAEQGGGIFNEGVLNLVEVTLLSNRAAFGNDGGGMYNTGEVEMTGGAVRACSAEGSGGGIFNTNRLTTQSVVFDFDSAGEHGAAVYSTGVGTILQSQFGVNEATLDGGSIYHAGPSMLIDRCEFLNNLAYGNGGAIYSAGSLSLQFSTLAGNIAVLDGGAILHNFGSLFVNQSEIFQNQCAGSGGGIHNSGTMQAIFLTLMTNSAQFNGSGLFNSGNALLSGSKVEWNYGARGAGIYNEGLVVSNASLLAGNFASEQGAALLVAPAAQTSLINSTVSGNTAWFEGGGAYVEGTLFVEFSTITDNSSQNTSAGGIYNRGLVSAKNSLFGDNAGDCEQLGAMDSLGYNLDSDGTCGLGAGAGDLIGVSPNLGLLQENGGPTRTHAPLFPSVALDSAEPNCLDHFNTPVTSDQRMMTRPMDGDGDSIAICDRGAHELSVPSGPQPPVPTDMLVGKNDPAGVDLELVWNTSLCPADGYHLIHGDLLDVAGYDVQGGQCGLSTSGFDSWLASPADSAWFVIVADDTVYTEGSWGLATSGQRKGLAPSGQCLMTARDNTGTCP